MCRFSLRAWFNEVETDVLIDMLYNENDIILKYTVEEVFILQLTIFSRVTRDNFGFRSPPVAVPALNFDLVRDERARVPQNKRVSFLHVILPVVLHPQFPVVHLVLQAGAVVFDRQQRLQKDNMLMT